MRVDIDWKINPALMHHGDCYLHQRNRTDMGSQIMALLLFWLPGIFLLVGILIYLLRKPEKQKKYGLLCAFISFGMILSTPWTLSASDSSAFGHFLGMIIGAVMLISLGLYNIVFSTPSPVQSLSKHDRLIGIICFLIGFSWIVGYHWLGYTPTYNGELNHYWLVFLTNVVVLLPILFFSFALLVGQLGYNRSAVAWKIFLFGGITFQLLLFGLVLDGKTTDRIEFSQAIATAVIELLGYAIGTLLAIIVFALIITIYESRLPKMKKLPPPSEKELEFARKTLKSHLGGGESE